MGERIIGLKVNTAAQLQIPEKIRGFFRTGSQKARVCGEFLGLDRQFSAWRLRVLPGGKQKVARNSHQAIWGLKTELNVVFFQKDLAGKMPDLIREFDVIDAQIRDQDLSVWGPELAVVEEFRLHIEQTVRGEAFQKIAEFFRKRGQKRVGNINVLESGKDPFGSFGAEALLDDVK